MNKDWKIYTKTGDDGTSGLIGGTRVEKDDPRLEAYGTLDEINAWMGVVRTGVHDEKSAKPSTSSRMHFLPLALFWLRIRQVPDPFRNFPCARMLRKSWNRKSTGCNKPFHPFNSSFFREAHRQQLMPM